MSSPQKIRVYTPSELKDLTDKLNSRENLKPMDFRDYEKTFSEKFLSILRVRSNVGGEVTQSYAADGLTWLVETLPIRQLRIFHYSQKKEMQENTASSMPTKDVAINDFPHPMRWDHSSYAKETTDVVKELDIRVFDSVPLYGITGKLDFKPSWIHITIQPYHLV